MLNLLLNASEAMNSIEDRPRQLVVITAPEEGDGARVAVRVKARGVGFAHVFRERVGFFEEGDSELACSGFDFYGCIEVSIEFFVVDFSIWF
ncbi:MAG: hypothetical protein HC853_01370, partial [Anaerolineae bacterium]|nr:hypothetical protein [Anaerolineae bacterium]